MDHLSPQMRSWNMSRIRSRDTQPEKLVRSILHRMGYRFRLHRRDLPGSPDIVMPKHSTIVLVHGCYWHRHPACRLATTPKTNSDFWEAKFQRTVARDQQQLDQLRRLGWNVIIVWECETKDVPALAARLSIAIAGNE